MAELAGIYDATPAPRPATSFPARTTPHPAPGPHARGKWLTASITDDIPAVIATAFDEAHRRDPDHRRPWVALVDGNTTQIEAIQAVATRRQVTLTIVLDFIHVLEYLWKAAWSFFDPGDPDAETWVADQATKILDGKAAVVAAGIRRRATRFGYSPSERKGADHAATYLTNKKPGLPDRSGQRVAHRHRHHRRRLPPHHQRQNGHHRSPLRTTRSPSHPHPPSTGLQRRL